MKHCVDVQPNQPQLDCSQSQKEARHFKKAEHFEHLIMSDGKIWRRVEPGECDSCAPSCHAAHVLWNMQLRDMKEGRFLFVWRLHRDTLRWSARKWVSEPLAASLMELCHGGGGLSPALWYLVKKGRENFHYSRFLSNMETVRWHRSASWFLHCFLLHRFLAVPAEYCRCAVLVQGPAQHSPLTCTVRQENAAACNLCNCAIRIKLNPLFENEVSKYRGTC